MSLKILQKKTSDLSDNDKNGIISLFYEVFLLNKNINWFDNIVNNTPNGYAYHTIMYDNDDIVGSYTVIPFYYNFFEKKTIFGLSLDTMIKKEYRGRPRFNVINMAKETYEWIASEGVSFVFGFPNDNIYLLRKKRLKWVDIGILNYYIFPINIENIVKFDFFKRILKYLSNLIIYYNWIGIKLSLLKRKKTYKPPISKVTSDLFDKYRYENFQGKYKKITTHGGFFTYTLAKVDGVNIAFIIDFSPYNNKLIENACNSLLKNHKNKVDAILYIGSLEFTPSNMFKVPRFFEPKKIYMSGKILTSDIDERVFQINNWSVNLSNYDVV